MYGAMLVGNIISSALYGHVTMQILIYLSTFYHQDHWSMVATVFILWFLETAHMYCVGNYLYYNLVSHYCSPISKFTKVEMVTPVVEALITFMVHCFYARRIWILSIKNWQLTGIISILAIAHFGFELSFMGLLYKFPRYDQLHNLRLSFTTALALTAGLDILIAGAIVYLLNRQRTGIKSTETLLNKIVARVVSSGALTSIIDVVILICFYAMPNNLWFLGIYVFISDLYAISLLTSLNARASLRNTPTNVHHVVDLQNHSLIDMRSPAAVRFTTGSVTRNYVPSVHVLQITTVDSDL